MDTKKTVDEKIDQALGIAPINDPEDKVHHPVPVIEVEFADAAKHDKEMETDFDYARQTIIGLVETGKELTKNSLQFARERQDSRSVEAAAHAQKETRENVLALIDIHRSRKELERISSEREEIAKGDTTINQTAVFYGTTGEMLKMMKELPSLGHIEDDGPIVDQTPHRRDKKTR